MKTPDTDRPGDRGAVQSGPNLFSIYVAHPASTLVSRHAHQAGTRMVTLLSARYGMPVERAFLRNGVPSESIKSLGSCPGQHPCPAVPNEVSGS